MPKRSPPIGRWWPAATAASDLGGRRAGLLRITVPRSVVPLIIRPMLASFAAAYPEIELDIGVNDEFVDIASQGFDAGMRLRQFIAKDMIAQRLTPPFRLVVVASPDYLFRRGTPKTVEDLQDHACLRLRRSTGGASPWRFKTNGGPLEVVTKGPLIAGDFLTLLDAAAEGVGLAQVPEPVAAGAVRSGALSPLLLGYAPQVPGVFLYYPNRRQVMPKLRVFIDHLKEHTRAPPTLDDPPAELGAAKTTPEPGTSPRDEPALSSPPSSASQPKRTKRTAGA